MKNMEDLIRRYNTRDWKPDRDRTAVLLIDLQEYFRGIIDPILDNIVRLVSAIRKAEIPILFSRHSHAPGEDHGMLGRWWPDLIMEESDEARLIPELKAGENNPIIAKNTYSAFFETGLEKRLRDMGVTDLVIGGVMTNLCCETTARDAFVRNFRVFFLADGTSTVSQEFHLAALKNLGYGFAVLLTCERFTRWMASSS